jgi:hypothetical protein
MGLGATPRDPMLYYAVRGGGLVQGAIGVLFWIMASDVVRYRPLILAVAGIFLLSAPAFFTLDSLVGLRAAWCLLDSVSCFVVGGVLLALCLRVPA